MIFVGGEGKIVEIDESLYVKVKHWKGKDMRKEQVWVFGMLDRKTGKIYFELVKKRDADTLLKIIYDHVLPGTQLHSDCWKSYERIKDLNKEYIHKKVNHSVTFIAPDGTHTNRIESLWNKSKIKFKDMRSVRR